MTIKKSLAFQKRPPLRVNVYNRQRLLPLSKTSVQHVVREVFSFESRETDEISIYFVSEKKISELHHQFFDDPSPTDCITLPMDDIEKWEGYHIIGEIFISPKAAIDYAKEENKYLELTLYLVHGLLHLFGFDDTQPASRKKMRLKEKKVMQHLISSNLIIK